ncbi:MAG: hypothetical protein AAF204_03170 [Pseudomonadota bacterium]
MMNKTASFLATAMAVAISGSSASEKPAAYSIQETTPDAPEKSDIPNLSAVLRKREVIDLAPDIKGPRKRRRAEASGLGLEVRI